MTDDDPTPHWWRKPGSAQLGLCYYVICLVVLYRLFSLTPGLQPRVQLAVLGGVTLTNAVWNY